MTPAAPAWVKVGGGYPRLKLQRMLLNKAIYLKKMKMADILGSIWMKLRKRIGCFAALIFVLVGFHLLCSPAYLTLYQIFFPIQFIPVSVPDGSKQLGDRAKSAGNCCFTYIDDYVTDLSPEEVVKFYLSEEATCYKPRFETLPKAQFVCVKEEFYINGRYSVIIIQGSDFPGGKYDDSETIIQTEIVWPAP